MPAESGKSFRMSVLQAVIMLHEFCKKHPETTPEAAAAALEKGIALDARCDYRTALDIVATVGDAITSVNDPPFLKLQNILERLILQTRPTWASLIPRGRGVLEDVLTDTNRNALQCLRRAGLYQRPPTQTEIVWWDRVAAGIRALVEEDKCEVGREGERLSFQLEVQRVVDAGISGKQVEWVGLEDNSLGYDILSYHIRNGEVNPKYIEVKATTKLTPSFLLSEFEWSKATSHATDYFLHFWHLPSGALFEIPVRALEPHVPLDRGTGNWKQVEIQWNESVPELGGL